jgi:nucleotide-binding universal stress UspA family protein
MSVDTVVVGLDGSEGSKGALRWVVTDFPEAEVVAVHGFPGDARFAVRMRPDLDRLRSDHERLLESDWAAGGSDHPSLRTMLIDSDGATALVKAAEEVEADAIVVGHKGRSAWSEASIGSVVGRILHQSDRPVIVTNPEVSPALISGPVVVALATFEPDGGALAWAAGFASDRGIPLALLHVVEPLPYVGRTHAVDLGPIHELGKGSLEGLVRTISSDYPGIDVSGEMSAGDPVVHLAEASRRASLVVVGSRRLGDARGYTIGSIAHHLPALAACPVVAVPL